LATGQPADAFRQKVIKDSYHSQLKVFEQEPSRAVNLLKIGESPRDESLDINQHATWTILCSMILNLDEAMNRE
jgi:hypothetical protein